MALAARPRIDFSSRLAAVRSVAAQLGLAANLLPDQSAANSPRAYLKALNACRTAVGLPLLLSLDYSSFTSALNAVAAAAASAAKPENTTLPVVTSNATPPISGSVLTTTNGVWANSAGATYAYQWLRDGVVIAGQTAVTHTVVAADVGGHELACQVTATAAAGTGTPAVSNFIVVP